MSTTGRDDVRAETEGQSKADPNAKGGIGSGTSPVGNRTVGATGGTASVTNKDVSEEENLIPGGAQSGSTKAGGGA